MNGDSLGEIKRESQQPKIVVLGLMSKMPVAGIIWLTMQYVIGFKRLGYDVYYVEAHGRTPSMFSEREGDDASEKAATFIDRVMRRFDLGDHWAFHALHAGGRCYGLSETRLKELYRSAALLINLHGGTEPLPEHCAADRLVYIGTDPVEVEIELYHHVQRAIDFLEPHCAFFTWGENYGNPDCKLPVSDRFQFKPTRQPVILDFWQSEAKETCESFTTIGNWRQPWREITFQGEVYNWSKHYEFLKFIDLPSHTRQPFELALSSLEEEDRRMLEGKGWRVRDALDISMDEDAYREYIRGSRGEFTVAKDQNVRLRSGWFSDRSATYLAAGRPVVTQETGFSNILPTGCGLFGFSTIEEILNAVEAVNSDYARHSYAAFEIAREYFSYDVVLTRLLEQVGAEMRNRPREAKRASHGSDSKKVGVGALPPEAHRVRIEAELPAELEPDAVIELDCVVENLGDADFASVQPYPVHISYKWIDPGTGLRLNGIEGLRTVFAAPLPPRQPYAFKVKVQAPPSAGEFILHVTLVQESIAWFDDLGEGNACSRLVRIVKTGQGRDEKQVMVVQ